MDILIAFGLLVGAGIGNASYAAPMKYIRGLEDENIWVGWGMWTFLVIPWVFILAVFPGTFAVWFSMPADIILFTIVGGVAFGLGQICFAFALHSVGLSLAFVLNIGISTGLGFLLPLLLQHPGSLHTPFGLVTIAGVVLAIVGIIRCTRAGELRDREHSGIAADSTAPSTARKGYWLGVLFAAIAGLASAGQNFSFSEAMAGNRGLQAAARAMGAPPLGAAIIFWPGFLFFAAIPYIGYMVYLLNKNGTWKNFRRSGTKRYYLFWVVMAAFWFGSLVLFSKASQIIGPFGPVMGWPLFMIFIILTSNFWGYVTGEWKGASRNVRRVMMIGVGFLIAAVIVISCGVALKRRTDTSFSALPPHHTTHHLRSG